MDSFTTFGYGPTEVTYTPNGRYQPPSGPFHQNPYRSYSDASIDFPHHGSHFAQEDPTDLLDDWEDGDGEGKGRLTHEQMVALEKEFDKDPKPKTSRKSEIAQRLRLGLPRVNNWYQNRRAKAKHMKQSAKDFDGSSLDGTTTSPERSRSVSEFDPQRSNEAASHNAVSQGFQAVPHNLEYGHVAGPMAGFDFGLDPEPENIDNLPEPNTYNDYLGTAVSSQHAQSTGLAWPNDDLTSSLPPPFIVPALTNHGSSNHSPQSSNGVPIYEAGYDHLNKNFDPSSVTLYHDALGAGSLNPHELTNVSPEVDFAHYMANPNEPHALPWLSDEPHSRRESESSELAHALASNCQVQQSTIGLAMPNTTVNPSTILPARDASPPVLTPDVSPSQTNVSVVPHKGDLATRRKAQRPTPLSRPHTNRSHSHGASPTMSPRGKGAPHTIRATQSHSVLNGRVSKPGSAHASPRHQQSQFELRPQREPHRGNGPTSNSPVVSAAEFTSFANPSSANSNQSWQQWSNQDQGLGYNGSQFYGNPNAFSSVPDLSATTPHPQNSNVQPLCDRTKQASPSNYDCPQSAPSHQTTFSFSEPPVTRNEALARPAWLPSQPHGTEYYVENLGTKRSDHSAHNSFSSSTYQPPFAPKSHFGILPGNPSLASSSHHLLSFTSIGAQPATEFKTELETQPGQIFVKPTAKDFNFSNSTPKDFNSPNGKRK